MPDAENDALARELRLRLRSAMDMLEEAQRRVDAALKAQAAHLETRDIPPAEGRDS